MNLEDMNYHDQEGISCCKNCANADVIVDILQGQTVICTLFHDEVKDTAICESFEF